MSEPSYLVDARSIIKRALKLIGVIGTGETPSGTEADEALTVLNTMVDQWTVDELMQYAQHYLSNNFTLKSGAYIYAFNYDIYAAGGAWPANYEYTYISYIPTNFTTMSVKKTDGTFSEIKFITEKEYYAISDRETRSGTPTTAFYKGIFSKWTDEVPTNLLLYPVPDEALEIYFTTDYQFDHFSDLDTTLPLPPMYRRAMEYNLAIELAPEYGVNNINQLVLTNAAESIVKIKRQNQRKPTQLKFNSVTKKRKSSYNISTNTN